MVNLSTAFNPQMDYKVDHTIQTLKGMLRACITDFKVNCNKNFPLVKFAYNIPTICLYLRLLIKPCKVGVVDLQLDDLKWVSLYFLVPD